MSKKTPESRTATGIEIDAEAFKTVTQAVQRTARAAPRQLQFVRYVAENGVLTAIACTAELWIRATAATSGKSSGVFALAVDSAIGLASITAGPMAVSTDEGGRIHVEIPMGKFVFEVPPNADDMPPFPKVGAKLALTAGLPQAVARALPAVSRDPSRGVIKGVRVNAKGCAATDGYRVHLAEVAATIDAVIPAALAEIIKDWPDDASVGTHESYVVATSKGVEVVAHVIEGAFPTIDRAVSKKTAGEIEVGRDAIEGAISTLIRLGGANARVVIGATKDGCVLTSRSGSCPIACTLQGKWCEIGVNGSFLLDAVHAVGGETVSIAQAAQSAVKTVQAPDMVVVKGESALCVVMGMNG